MEGLGGRSVEAVESTVGDVVETVEEIFLPKPGGLIERAREDRARREAAQRQKENIDQRIEDRSYKAVKVAPQSPEIISGITVTVPAAGTVQLLPLSPYRYRASLLVIGNFLPTAPTVFSTMAAPAVPPTTVYAQNTTNQNYTVVISGGTLTAVMVNGLTVGQGDGTYTVPPGQGIAVTYTVAPTWTWTATNVSPNFPTVTAQALESIVLAKDQGSALGGVGFVVPAGLPYTFLARSQYWAYNPGALPVQVTLLAEIYAPE